MVKVNVRGHSQKFCLVVHNIQNAFRSESSCKLQQLGKLIPITSELSHRIYENLTHQSGYGRGGSGPRDLVASKGCHTSTIVQVGLLISSSEVSS